MSSAAQPIIGIPAVSEKKLAANRANALKSTGPRSPAGKVASTMNSYRHGLTGNILAVAVEEQPVYFQMAHEYVSHFQPWCIEEVQLVQKIVDTNWRLNRISALENNLFNIGLAENLQLFPDNLSAHAVAQAKAWREDCAGPNSFEKLGRYEQRLQRALFKFTEEFKRVRQERRNRELTLSGIDRPWIPGDPDSFTAEQSHACNWYQKVYYKAQDLLENLNRREHEERTAAADLAELEREAEAEQPNAAEPPVEISLKAAASSQPQSTAAENVPETPVGSFCQIDPANVAIPVISRKTGGETQ